MRSTFDATQTVASSVSDRVLHLADRFLPSSGVDERSVREAQRARVGIVISWLGAVCVAATATLYIYVGSPWSAVAISSILVPLLLVGPMVRRGVSLMVMTHLATAVTWFTTFAVASRTGGFQSPVVVWSFFHPITTYVTCGRRSAAIWSALSIVQVGVFYAAESFGFPVVQELSTDAANVLRATGFIGCIVANVALIAAIEGVRVASQAAVDRANRTLERERILGDMHDGVGSHLLGLMMQVRANRIDNARLVQGLVSCLDDLKLIVDSLDPIERSFEVAMGELRARVEPRCAAADLDLTWSTVAPATAIDAERTLQVLRALQEMINNAIRHSQGGRIDVELSPAGGNEYVVSVRDHGVGFNPLIPSGSGRGMTSLQSRAQRLHGSLVIERSEPGARLVLRFPLKEGGRAFPRRVEGAH